MTLEESMQINNIIAEIQAKRGNSKINVDSLTRMLNRILKDSSLNKITSEIIETALDSIKELTPNRFLIEQALFVMTYNKSKEYKDIKQYVTDFEDLKIALEATFFDEDFNLSEKLLSANPVLYNLILEYRKAEEKMINDNISLGLSLNLDSVLEYIFILFFLHPSDYEYKYELLVQTVNNIIDNQRAFENGIQLKNMEVLQEEIPENKEGRRILFAKALLDQQYIEPIKSTKKA